ncbi:nitrite reductase small subunit NirD [Paenibacillus sp. CAU 1782]
MAHTEVQGTALRYVSVGKLEQFPVRVGRAVKVEDQEIAIFRTTDNAVYALHNVNPHRKGGPLSEGIVSGHKLYDPLYDTKIDLATGAVYAPDTGQATTYPALVENDEILVGLPA